MTPDALFVGGPPCGATTPCVGAAAIRGRFQTNEAIHSSFNLTNVQVLGSAVTVQFEFRTDMTRTAGVDRILESALMQIPQDRIAAEVAFLDPTDPQTVAYQAFVASQATPQQVDRAAVIRQFFDAENANDVDTMMSYVDAGITWIGASCTRQSPCQGADAVRRFFAGPTPALTNPSS